MADDGRLSLSTGLETSDTRLDVSSNKRKFENVEGENETPGRDFGDGGRGNLSQNHDVHSSVPPVLSPFEIAKQRAAEIAARLVGSAPAGAIMGGEDGVKRSRTDDKVSEDREVSNGGIHEHSYGEVHRVSKFSDQPIESKSSYSTPVDIQQTPYYNHQVGYSESKRFDIPNPKVGIVIGKGGETIKNLQYQSGAKIQVTRDADADLSAPTRQVEIMGTPEQISRAEQLIKDAIAEAEAGASAAHSTRAFGGSGGEQASIRVLNSKVGLIIGKGGETIRSLQNRSGARIQFAMPEGQSDRDSQQGLEKIVNLTGTKQQIDMASQMIRELVDESRVRGPPMLGGYNQSFSRPRGPPMWGPPRPTQQFSSYGSQQHGPYPAPHQYPPPPPPHQHQYGGYSQPPPAGFNSGWNQTPQNLSQQPPEQGTYTSYPHQNKTPQVPQVGASAADGNYAQNPQNFYGNNQQQSASYQHQSLQQGPGQPQQGYSQPHQNPTQPEEYSQQPQDGYTQPHQGYNQQQDSQPQQAYFQPHQSYSQPHEVCSQSQDGYTQPQQGYNQQQGSHNAQQEYSQQIYGGGYDYNQVPQDQQSYTQQGYPQQSYGES